MRTVEEIQRQIAATSPAECAHRLCLHAAHATGCLNVVLLVRVSASYWWLITPRIDGTVREVGCDSRRRALSWIKSEGKKSREIDAR